MSDSQSTVEYRDVEGFPGYRVGSDGSIWSNRARREAKEWRLLKPSRIPTGHLHVVLSIKGKATTRHVHRLVLEAFVGPCPEGMECRHFPDRDPTNNRLENLCWDTHANNLADRNAHGTMPRGERGGGAKLTAPQVLEIRRRLRGEGSSAAVAREFGVTQALVYRIIKRKVWAHLPEEE